MKQRKDCHRLKKTTAAIAAAAVVCTMSIPTAVFSTSAATLGDINGDGSLTSVDVSTLQNALLGKSTLTSSQFSNADLTGDGVVNGADLSYLRQLMSEPVSDAIYIHLKDSGITVEGDTMGVTSLSNSNKKVTITASGTYYVDGSITDGQIYIETPDSDTDSVDLYLTSVEMTTTTGNSCILAANNKAKLKITYSGTNSITDTSATTSSDSGLIYAESDITLTKNSTGTLDLISDYNIGIYTTDDLKLNGGTLNIETDGGDDIDAIKVKESIDIDGATIDIDASGDGIKSTKEDVSIESGTISIKAGSDAIQASSELAISGGTIVACGDRGLRLDEGGKLIITGGDIIATGTDYGVNTSSAKESYDVSDCTQTVMQFSYASEQSKKTDVTLQQNGSTVFSMTPIKKYDHVLVSNSKLSNSGSYQLYTDGTQMTHDDSKDGTFANSGAWTDYTGVTILAGGGTIDTSNNEATELVYTNSGITAYNDSGATLSAPTNVTISGTTATITQESEVEISGTCNNGQIVVDVDESLYPDSVVTLSLTGLTLNNNSSAAILVESIGDEVQISAKNGSVNNISDGSNYTATDSTGDSITAAIYSRDDIKFKGKGTLNVTGNCEDGIVCKDDIKIWNGTINVTANDEGIRGNDSVRIGDPDDDDYSTLALTVNTSGGDGIRTKSTDDDKGYIRVNGGTVNVNCNADTGDAFQAKQSFYMYGGDINIFTYDGYTHTGTGYGQQMGGIDEGNNNATENSCKGIKAVGRYEDESVTDNPTYKDEGNIWIYDGTVTVNSADDCIHAGGNVYLYGGTYDLRTADDGIHSDNDLYLGQNASSDINDPYIEIGYSYEGVEGYTIVMNSGSCLVYSTDDGFNAAGGNDKGDSGNGFNGGMGGMMPGANDGGQCLTFNGGYTYVNSNGGDGVDSNGDMYLNGGYVFVSENDSNNEAIDYGDANNSCYYNGGVVVAVGNGQAMSDMPSNAVFDYSSGMGGMGGNSTALVSAGQTVSVVDNSTNQIIAVMTVPADVSMMTVCAEVNSATVYAGATVSGATYLPSIKNCTYDTLSNRCGYGGTSSGGTQLTSQGNVSGGTSGNMGGDMTGPDPSGGGAPGSLDGGNQGGQGGK